ncbi:photosystem II 5 kDa protein, chloroplastic [Telopea speciosissima]|uniref:photosystem II 5 kDa protein, chloroplastic n=1 Tax=Telopea speciosissima TaxID=54955 RepID=UPI001CC4F798|nr:photosystem II 5 kDa protein, chloroplastic [Telopea speciosissima]
MASITMSTSLLSGINVSQRRSATTHRSLVVSNAASAAEVEQVKLSCNNDKKNESSNGRRDLMFAAAAAAAVCSIAGVAVAREEPKRGTPEAKKLYAPVCVTMPTARICRK